MKVLKVFTNEKGEYGNSVGIVVDIENKIDRNERQKIATASGFSEVVFVNSVEKTSISIYSPQNEIAFAGHAIIGAAYFFNHEYDLSVTKITTMANVIETWQENNLTWIKSNVDILPNWNYEQLENAELVEKLTLEETIDKDHVVIWAWIDKDNGLIRARTFASDWGIPEDEANGSGSMKLATSLGREITIIHGQGSVIHAHPDKGSMASVGGRVKFAVK
jgi:predicted PhzF superfamily epimerase YddE/YHI9